MTSVVIRRRRPGGGRKPAGPYSQKTCTLSTRITKELRAELDYGAMEHGWSLSQEVEFRLRQSFEGSQLLDTVA